MKISLNFEEENLTQCFGEFQEIIKNINFTQFLREFTQSLRELSILNR